MTNHFDGAVTAVSHRGLLGSLNGGTLAFVLRGERVVVAGLVSAKEDAEARVAEVSAGVVREGGEIVGVVVQRRGVSRAGRPGGARRMADALDRTTFIGPGKARELAEVCAARGATVLVFLNELEPRQRDALAAMTGTRVLVREVPPGGPPAPAK